MLKNERRLRKQADFQKLYRAGKVARSRYFILRYMARSDHLPSRIGFAPARKIGSNPARNKVKRRAREICRLHQEGIVEGYDLVINIGVSARRAKQETLRKDLLTLLAREGLFLGER